MLKYNEWLDHLIIVRGAGDLASGILYRLHQCHFPILALEIDNPSCIRRTVSFCEAVFDKRVCVEDVYAALADSLETAYDIYIRGEIPVMIDPDGKILSKIRPKALVDAIIAKRNLGTRIDQADMVIGVGPGFEAGVDCHSVVETKRGHNLGRVYYKGMAAPNSGVPGNIGGYAKERVIHAPASGKLHIIREIGSLVEAGEVIAKIEETEVTATIPGLLRGMIREGFVVYEGLKIADIDPRLKEIDNYQSISDKARSIGGGVIEALLHLGYGQE